MNTGPKPSNKDDLKRVYIANSTATADSTDTPLPHAVLAGDVLLALAWERIPQNTTSASAHVAFEFNQADPSTQACPGSAPSNTLFSALPG